MVCGKRLVGMAASALLALSLVGCTSGSGAPAEGGQAPASGGTATEATPAPLAQLPTSNFASSNGSVTYLDGYAYFVAGGADNDCAYNGSAASAAIWRIAEGADAQPELVYQVPAEIVYGTQQDTLYCLTSAGDRIAFVDASGGQNVFRWVSTDGLQTGTYEVDVDNLQAATALDGALFLTTMRELNPDDPADRELMAQGPVEFKRVLIDIATGEVGQLDLPAIEGQPYQVVGMGEGYAYLVKFDTAAQTMVNGLYRTQIGGSEVEEIAAVDAQRLSESVRYEFAYATAEWFYYVDSETYELIGIDVATGTSRVVLGAEAGFSYVDGWPNLCFAGDEIYYFVGADLYVCAADGSDARQLIQDPDPEFEKGWMAVGGDWVYYGEVGINSAYFHRVATDGRIFPASPIVNSRFDFEEQQEGDWTYLAYPKFACVTGYVGTEPAVTVPTEIGGLPVLSVSGEWASRQWVSVTDLVIPEGVRSLGYFETDHSMTIHLPASLELFTSGTLVSTFGETTQVTVDYAGTLEQWQALCEFRSTMYDGGPESGARNVTVNCADGTLEYGVGGE